MYRITDAGVLVHNQSFCTPKRFIFRADDAYTGGDLGAPLKLDVEIDELALSIIRHVKQIQRLKDPRFTSFSTVLSRTKKFTRRNRIYKAEFERLQALTTGNSPTIRMFDPDYAREIILQAKTPKIQTRAQEIYQRMIANQEIIIEGVIPAELIKRAYT